MKDFVDKTIRYVNQYYRKHKQDFKKPAIWDLILSIKFLDHETRRLQRQVEIAKTERICSAKDCHNQANVLTFLGDLFCTYHAIDKGCCPFCGDKLDTRGYCPKCNNYWEDYYPEDYDNDFKWDER